MAAPRLELTVVLKGDGSGLTGTVRVSKEELRALGATLDDVGKKADGASRKMDQAARAGEAAGKLIGAAVTAAAAGFVVLVKNAIDVADQTGKMAQRLNLSTEALSSLQQAARSNNEELRAIPTAMIALETSAAKAAAGSRSQAADFKALGVTLRDTNSGALKPTQTLLEEVATKLASYREGAAKTALTNRLFGESGSELTATLKQLGEEGFDALKMKAADAGRLIGDETAAKAAKFNDQVQVIQDRVASAALTIAEDLLPMLTEGAERFAAFIDEANRTGSLKATLAEVWGVVRDGVSVVRELDRAMRDLTGINTDGFLKTFRDQSQKEVDGIGRFLRFITTPTAGSPAAQRELASGQQRAIAAGADAAANNPFSGADTATLVATSKPLLDDLARMWRSVTGEVDEFGLHVKQTAVEVNKPDAPLPTLGRQSRDTGAAVREQASSMEALTNFADQLAAHVGGPLDEALQRYQNSLTRADQLAEQALINGNSLENVLAAQGVAYANAAAVRDEAVDKIAEESDVEGKLLTKLDAELAARAKSALALKAEQTVRTALQSVQKIGVERTAEETQAIEDQVAGRLAMKAALDYAEELREDTIQLDAEYAARGRLSPLQEADLRIRKLMPDLLKLDAAEREKVINALKGEAAAKQKVLSLNELEGDFGRFVGDITQGVRSGQNAWEAFGAAANSSLVPILRSISQLNAATGNWSETLAGLGQVALKNLPAIGQMLGTVAMATIGGKDGKILAGVLSGAAQGSYFGWWGAAIGAVVGGIMGSMGGDKPPKIYGSSIPGSVSRDRRVAENTPLGIIATDTNNLPDDAYAKFAAQVKAFDIELAKMLSPDQLVQVKAALEGWHGKFSDIESLLTSRFDAVLGALDASIGTFVNEFAGDLQGRVQALADVLQIQKLIQQDQGIKGLDLDRTLALIGQLAAPGERVAETFQRLYVATDLWDRAMSLMGATMDGTREDIVRFAAEIADAAGGVERAQSLWSSFFAKFYSEDESAQRAAASARERANTALSDLGLDPETTMAQFRQAFETALPTLTPEQIATWLEAAKALSDATDAQKAYTDAQREAFEALQQGQADYASFIAGLNQEGLGLATVSPFAAQKLAIEKWEQDSIKRANDLAKAAGLQGIAEQDLLLIRRIAERNLVAAMQVLEEQSQELVYRLRHNGAELSDAATSASSAVTSFGGAMTTVARRAQEAMDLLLGDKSPYSDQRKLEIARGGLMAGTVTQDQFLEIARRLFGTTAQYTREFLFAQQFPGRGRNAASVAGDSYAASNSASASTPPTYTDAQRLADAQQLAQNIVSLANEQKVSYESVADKLDYSLSELAKDLGLSSDELTVYLDNLKAQENAVPDSIAEGTRQIVDAIYDVNDRERPIVIDRDSVQHGPAVDRRSMAASATDTGRLPPANVVDTRDVQRGPGFRTASLDIDPAGRQGFVPPPPPRRGEARGGDSPSTDTSVLTKMDRITALLAELRESIDRSRLDVVDAVNEGTQETVEVRRAVIRRADEMALHARR